MEHFSNEYLATLMGLAVAHFMLCEDAVKMGSVILALRNFLDIVKCENTNM